MKDRLGKAACRLGFHSYTLKYDYTTKYTRPVFYPVMGVRKLEVHIDKCKYCDVPHMFYIGQHVEGEWVSGGPK